MKKISILLCSIGIACAVTGCGSTMPELTQEENEVITEYAVGLLLKYDKNYNSHLVELPEEEEPEEPPMEETQPAPEEEEQPENTAPDTPVVDMTEEAMASSIEEFYDISGFAFQYAGYEIKQEYPDMAQDGADVFFAMEATPGTQLLVLKFQAVNQNGADAELDMLDHDVRMRIRINDEITKNALSTMLLDDIQTYKGTIAANGSTQLVAITEVPEGTSVQNISITLRNGSDRAEISLQ